MVEISSITDGSFDEDIRKVFKRSFIAVTIIHGFVMVEVRHATVLRVPGHVDDLARVQSLRVHHVQGEVTFDNSIVEKY